MNMPRYTNSTGETVTVPGRAGEISIPDGQTVEVDFFIPSEYGLTLTDDEPRVSPQILKSGTAELYNGDALEIAVPGCKTFVVSMVCKSGASEIRENYVDAESFTPCDTLNMFRAAFKRLDVESIWLKGVGDDAKGASYIAYVVAKMS
jgi:hypothetical protein